MRVGTITKVSSRGAYSISPHHRPKELKPEPEWVKKGVQRVLRKFPERVAELTLDMSGYSCEDTRALFELIFSEKVREIELLFERKMKDLAVAFSVTIDKSSFKAGGYTFKIRRGVKAAFLEREYTPYLGERLRRRYGNKRFYHFASCPFTSPKIWFLNNFDQIKAVFKTVSGYIKEGIWEAET